MLISPIKSVKDVARMKYGRIVDLLIEERFNNFQAVTKVQCPSAIFHGVKDTMVPYQHSLEMLLQGFTNCQAHMFLRDGMEHNKFDYTNDLIKPIRYFLKHHEIEVKPKKRLTMSPLDGKLGDKLKKNTGYIDKKALNYAKMFGITNRSQYYNNFQQRFTPQMPSVNVNGEYTDDDLKIQKFEHSQVSKDSSEIFSPLSRGSNMKDMYRMESKVFEVNKYLPPDDGPLSPQGLTSRKLKISGYDTTQILSKDQQRRKLI